MAVSFDAQSIILQASSPTSPFTDATHTIGASATALTVYVDFIGTPTGIAMTWNGVGMTLIGTQTYSTGLVSAYGLASPATGNHTLSISWSGGTVTVLTGLSVSWNGTNTTGGTTTFPGSTTNTGTTVTTTVTVPSAPGDVVTSISAIRSPGGWTSKSGDRTLFVRFNATDISIAQASSGAASVTQTATSSGVPVDWAVIGHNIKSAVTGKVQLFLTSGTSLAKPADWTEAGHTVELIGAGGNGGVGTAGSTTWRSGTGGGGGGYSKLTYLSGTTGTNFTYAIGVANTSTASNDGTAGTYWENTTSTNSYEARGGRAGFAGGVGTAGGTGGGTITNGTPAPVTYTTTTSFTGGAGGATAAVTAGAGGGGGAAGPFGNGGAGGASVSSGFGGGGGGAADGGSSAATTTSANGGTGANGRGNSVGGGTGGVTGTPAGGDAAINGIPSGSGSGGGGGFTSSTGAQNSHGGNAAMDTVSGLGPAMGAGGGGGGGGGNTINTTGATTSGGNAATFGGGGGGSGGTRSATSTRTSGTGAPGLIVITYTQLTTTGTWASTDTKDVMAFAGLAGDFGPLAATDTQDHLAFSGTVLVAGSFAVTDTKDVASFSGITGDFGPWASTDTADVLAFAGLAGVFGSFALTDPTDVALIGATVSSYDVSTQVSDIVITAGPNQYAVIGNPVTGSINVNLLASGSTIGSIVTVVGDPGTNGTSTGNFQLRLLFSPTNSFITVQPTIKIYRSGTLIGTEPASTALPTTTNGGILTWNWTNPALGSWSAGDRLFFQLTFVNTNSGVPESTALQLDGINSLVDVPWTPTVAISGTWSSGDTTDVMAFVGRADPVGTWASTEATDVFAASGTVQWFGTWASTETTDTAAFAGLAGDFGAWASTGAADTMVFTGNVQNFGSFAVTDIQDTGPLLVSTYGSGIGGYALGNTQLGHPASTGGLRQFNRFRAEQTSTLVSARFYYLIDPGYGAGTGGTWKVEVQTDDGTANHFPSGTVLATESFAASFVDDTGRLITFSSPPALIAGNLYHLVYTNTDTTPNSNYFSLDYWIYPSTPTGALNGQDNPRFAATDWTTAFEDSGVWTPRAGYAPILGLVYGNGQSQGQSYGEASYGVGEVGKVNGTANMVRETFTVSGSTISISSVGIRLLKIAGGTDPLVVRLETSGGSLIEAINIPAASIPDGPAPSGISDSAGLGVNALWVNANFTSSHVLTSGSSYNLQFSTAAGTTYYMWVERRLSAYSYTSSTYFSDGDAQATTDGGSTWPLLGRISGENDLQFYLGNSAPGFGPIFVGSVSISGTWASTDTKDVLSYSGTVEWNAAWASTDTKDTLAFAGLVGLSGTFVATDLIDNLAYSGTVAWTTSFALTDITDVMSFAGAPASFGPWASTEDTDILSFSSSTQTLGTFNTTDIQDTTFAWLVDDNGDYVVDGSGNRIQIGGFYGIVGSTATFAMTDGQDQAALNGLVSGNLGPLAATDTQDVMSIAGTVATIFITGVIDAFEADYLQGTDGALILDVNGDPIGLSGIDTMVFRGSGAGTGTLAATDNTDIASINVSTETDGSFAVTDPTDVANFNAVFGIFGDWNSIEDQDYGSPLYLVDGSGNFVIDQFGNYIIAGRGPVFIGLVGVAVGPWASTDPIDLMDFHGNTGAGPTHSGVQRIELAIKRKIEWIVAKEIVEKVYDRDLQWLDNVDFDSMIPTERVALIDTIAQSIEMRYLVDQGMLLTDLYKMVDEIKVERQQQDDEEAITFLLEDA